MDTPFPGSLSPVTLAGTIALSNANILAGLTLAQIINPGTPLIYCFYGGIMDMNVGSHVFGTPESALYTAAAVQLCHLYQVPSNMTVPAVSAKVPDAQCSFEKMMNALLPALSGVDCLSLFGGILDFGMSASYEQMLIDNEMAGQINYLCRGFEVTPQTLAEDVIKSIGHGGHFLQTEHTLRHFKEELFFPILSDRNGYETWKKQGSNNIVQRAEQKVEEILQEPYLEDHLTAECSRDVDNVVKDILQREKVYPVWLT
jgi:trimethylamine--corrinoid protein Co-methyltransferase